jgi:hypothetical protein
MPSRCICAPVPFVPPAPNRPPAAFSLPPSAVWSSRLPDEALLASPEARRRRAQSRVRPPASRSLPGSPSLTLRHHAFGRRHPRPAVSVCVRRWPDSAGTRAGLLFAASRRHRLSAAQNPNPGARGFSSSGSVCLHAAKPVAGRTRRSARLATDGKTGARFSGQPGSRSCAYRATGLAGRGEETSALWRGRGATGGAARSRRVAFSHLSCLRVFWAKVSHHARCVLSLYPVLLRENRCYIG